MRRGQVDENDSWPPGAYKQLTKLIIQVMGCIIFMFAFSFTLIGIAKGSDERNIGKNAAPELEILPDLKGSENTLYRRVSDPLNLTCRVNWRKTGVKPPSKFHIFWTTPPDEKAPWEIKQAGNSISMYVAHLLMKHNGDYRCEAYDRSKGSYADTLSATVRVIVRKNCSQEMFVCPSEPGTQSLCIHKKFVCDGKRDCLNGEDESFDLGHCDPNDPCKDKLICDDGRCIPLSWCCSNSRSPCNVTYPLPCCRKLNDSQLSIDHFQTSYRGLMDETDSPSLSHMGFLQTTIYSVIGCAMAFMLIVSIVVVAICRVHMKRTVMAAAIGRGVPRGCPPQGGTTHQGSLYDLDLYLSSHSGLLVTYNINDGVQFVGRPIDPPPYSEVVASPPREGPPPPYVSHENLSRIAVPENENEDGAPHESDALLSTVHLPVPAYSPSPSSQTVTPELSGMSSSSTQTGNTESGLSPCSLLTGPVTIDAGTQVSSIPDSHASTSSSVERLDRSAVGVLPPSLLREREGSIGRLRESFIGVRDRGKEEPVISNVGKQSSTVEPRSSRSSSRDRSNV